MAREFDDDGIICGLDDLENADQTTAIQDAFTEDMTGTSRDMTGASRDVVGTPGGSRRFALLTAAQQATASLVFGTSLDFSGIYLSTFTGINNRPFTLAFAVPMVLSVELGLSSVYIINCGSFTPGTPTLIHELTHVWQSQHHQDSVQYIQNSIASQAMAVSLNLSAGSLKSLSPFSPYAYIPGKAFSEYGAEQVAKQVEKGVAPIVAHVASIGMGVRDDDNEVGLATPRCENKTAAGVQF